MKGNKTRNTSTQNGAINITVSGCRLVTLSLVPEVSVYIKERRKIITGGLHSLISGNG